MRNVRSPLLLAGAADVLGVRGIAAADDDHAPRVGP